MFLVKEKDSVRDRYYEFTAQDDNVGKNDLFNNFVDHAAQVSTGW